VDGVYEEDSPGWDIHASQDGYLEKLTTKIRSEDLEYIRCHPEERAEVNVDFEPYSAPIWVLEVLDWRSELEAHPEFQALSPEEQRWIFRGGEIQAD
jgi:hypothetical protein